jgi:hypothetical protein
MIIRMGIKGTDLNGGFEGGVVVGRGQRWLRWVGLGGEKGGIKWGWSCWLG